MLYEVITISRDGEDLDGFEELIETIDDPEYGPLVPTEKCKRCGCWLRADREKDQSRDSQPVREYCAICQIYMTRHSKYCFMCGETFFSDDPLAIRCEKCERDFQKNKSVCTSCGEESYNFV